MYLQVTKNSYAYDPGLAILVQLVIFLLILALLIFYCNFFVVSMFFSLCLTKSCINCCLRFKKNCQSQAKYISDFTSFLLLSLRKLMSHVAMELCLKEPSRNFPKNPLENCITAIIAASGLKLLVK